MIGPAPAQDKPADNPLAILKDEVKRILADAKIPFTESQEKAVVLMMEDRRKASEDLFGNLMDFTAGPTQGQNEDQLRSAIDWMRNEFLTRLKDYLNPEQLAIWNTYQQRIKITGTATERVAGEPPRAPQRPQQTQYVRINNNAFTSEELSFRLQAGGGQGAPEVIQRGGAGAFHGNAQFLLKDESLNASRRSYNLGRRIPTIKPPYQERQTSFNLSGPVIPARLSLTVAGSQNEAENVDTINASLASGEAFSREVVRPTVNRSISTGGTYQLTDRDSLTYNIGYAPYTKKNQGIGAFTLPERAWTTRGNTWDLELKQFSAPSAQSIFENRFKLSGSHEETIPLVEAQRINVLDAFSSGGAQNNSETTGRTYDFGSLYTRLGEKWTTKSGIEGIFRDDRTISTANFGGTYTFSSLNAYRSGRPISYRISRGEPLLDTSQLELSFFMQNDLKVTPRLTFMYGLRYDVQTNLRDRNNFGPRLAFAYGAGNATVIRGGAGLFHSRFAFNVLKEHRRFEGEHQYEIVIDNPSYPDPFQSGVARPRSIRVTHPNLKTPMLEIGMISVERTFLTNLFLSASYDFLHEAHRVRLRNINATYDLNAPIPTACSPSTSAAACVRPDPTRGIVLNLESSSAELMHTLRLNFRKRFSIFTAAANYQYQHRMGEGNPSGNELAMNHYNLRLEWSQAGSFPRHTVSNTVNARLPLGLFLTETMSYNSGRYYSITTGTDDNKDSNVNDRPAGVGRNSGHAPAFLVFNFNISKAFFFGGAGSRNGGPDARTRANLNVFANMTNAFNHVNYNEPSGVMTSPNFGLPTSATDPRQLEVGMRFQF
jgi:hypothetical protein